MELVLCGGDGEDDDEDVWSSLRQGGDGVDESCDFPWRRQRDNMICPLSEKEKTFMFAAASKNSCKNMA